MSSPTNSISTITGEANGEVVPQKVDIGNLRLQDDNVEETKKKKRRPNKKRATGFEEFYCDPPMTPVQYQEEHEVAYPPHRPFVDRIQECIQRFRALRRMDNTQDNIFSAYLFLGGVDSTQRQFQGTRKLKSADLEGYTKAEVREITADDVIQRGGEGACDVRFYNPRVPEHWDIDFTAVASGFLSEHLSGLHAMDTIEYQKGVAVVLNFLKYVASHDVCPEYTDDLRRAQKVCVAALEEAQAIFDLGHLLPGTLNLAGNVLLDDEMEPSPDQEWAPSPKAPFDREAARTIVLAHGSVLLDNARSERLQTALNKTDILIVKGTGCFEVVDISLPSKATIAQLEIATKCMNQHFKQDLSLDACGRLVVRPTFVRDGWQVTESSGLPVMTTLDGKHTTAKIPEFFFVEMEALKMFKIGMRIQMNFITLDDGLINFISKAEKIFQSFYTFLPQELMMKYKEPKDSERPAKSIHDLGDDDDVLKEIPFDD